MTTQNDGGYEALETYLDSLHPTKLLPAQFDSKFTAWRVALRLTWLKAQARKRNVSFVAETTVDVHRQLNTGGNWVSFSLGVDTEAFAAVRQLLESYFGPKGLVIDEDLKLTWRRTSIGGRRGSFQYLSVSFLTR